MNVVIITDYWKNSLGGGVKTYLTNLVDQLKVAGIKTDVIFYEGTDPANYTVTGNRLQTIWKSLVYLNKLRPSAVNSQNTWYCLLPGCIYKLLAGAKLIHTFHSVPAENFSGPAMLFTRHLLSYCDTVAFVSQSLQQEYEKVYRISFKNAAITYSGILKKEVSSQDIAEFKAKHNLKTRHFVLLAQALTATKCKAEGARLLIRSLVVLSARYPDMVLILTRDGPYVPELKDYAASLGISDRVIFTGNLEEPFIPLAICDIFTHISFCDGLPLAILEAMSMGKPVVATRIGGIPEAIDHGIDGVLVTPELEEIVRQIEYLLANQEIAKKLGAAAIVKATTVFTWQNSVKNYAAIYGVSDAR